MQGIARIPNRTDTDYYHNDHLGTPQKMTDSSGTVVWSADCKPFGEATITNNLRFPGQYFDAETGLLYNLNRDYDSVIGKYKESDPIGILPRGSLGDLNHLYNYASNNPVRFTDPDGLKVQKCYRPLKNGAFFLYHQYLVVNGTSYGFFDDSKVHKNDPWDQPGWGTHCVTISDDECKDKCISKAISSYNPPAYNVNTNNCYDWVSKILSMCGS